MKIQNIKINHFGNLNDKEIDLENKINIIYGKNESGKSTLLAYIKNILYGISRNKNGREISDYDKYKPWLKEDFSGRLKYSLDNGETFEIFRDFNKKSPKIFNKNLEEISKEFNIDKKDGVQFFYEQTKVDEEIFLSTIVSMQQEVKLDKNAQNTLIQKITNLVGTGDDNISYKKIIDKLSKKQVDEIGTDRTQGKPINIIKKRMQEIEIELKELENKKREKSEYLENEEKIKQNIIKLEKEEEILKILQETILNSEIENEKINLKNNIKIQNIEKINKLNLEKENLIKNINEINTVKNDNEEIKRENRKENKKEKNNNKIKHMILLILFILIFTIMQFVKNNIINYLSYLLIPIYLIYIITDNIIKNNKIKTKEKEEKLKIQLQEEKEKLEQEKLKTENVIINNKIENIDNNVNELINENEKINQEINDLQKRIDNSIDLKIEEIKIKYSGFNIEEILDNLDLKNIKNQLINILEKINNNRIELNTIEIERKNIENKLEKLISMQEEYENLEEEKENLEKQTMNIELTKRYLNTAYEKMKNQISPKFTENLSKNISSISNNKYNKISINDEEGLIVENEYGEYVSANRLSIGTIDQLYLSLRLSMIDEISEENMPIILDEAFAYYDEARLENILKFLHNQSDNNQVIIFTCTKREQNILNKLGIQYNLVELSA